MQNIWKQLKGKSHVDKAVRYTHIIEPETTRIKPLISVENLWIGYGNWGRIKYILENVSFNIYPDQIVALLGGNGAGKSTLINAIVGVVKYQKGTIKFNESNFCSEEFIGVQFQDLKFPQGLTVKDMINFQINMLNNSIAIDLLDEMLTCFKFHDMLHKHVSKLSGGQQQRLNVLLALLTKPQVLILDEFTTGLDIASKNEITEYIYGFAKKYKIAIILITHDIDSIQKLADHFIVLGNHKIVVDASRKLIMEKFNTIDLFLKKYIK